MSNFSSHPHFEWDTLRTPIPKYRSGEFDPAPRRWPHRTRRRACSQRTAGFNPEVLSPDDGPHEVTLIFVRAPIRFDVAPWLGGTLSVLDQAYLRTQYPISRAFIAGTIENLGHSRTGPDL